MGVWFADTLKKKYENINRNLKEIFTRYLEQSNLCRQKVDYLLRGADGSDESYCLMVTEFQSGMIK